MPADAVIYVGWDRVLDDSSRLTAAVQAVLHSPLIQSNTDGGLPVARAIAELVRLGLTNRGGLCVVAGPKGFDEPPMVALVLRGAPAADYSASMTAILNAAGVADEIRRASAGGTDFNRIETDGGPPLLWTTVGDAFVMAFGEPAAAMIAGQLVGGKPSLADGAEYKLTTQKVRTASDAWGLFGYADMGRFIRMAMDEAKSDPGDGAAIEKLFAGLGLESLRGLAASFGPCEYGSQLSLFWHADTSGRSMARFWKQEPLRDDDLALVPAECYYASVSNFDLSGLWSGLREALDESNEETVAMVDGALAAAAQFLGFSIPDQLLPALGDTWACYDSPQHGGILFTGTVVIAEARDAEALHGMLVRSVEIARPLAAQANVDVQIKQMQRDGRTIHYVLVGGWPVPIAPAWTFVGDRWILGLFPQTVAVAAAQADPKTRGPSLLDNADYRAARKLLPENLTSVSFVDSRFFYHLAYTLRQLVETAIASMSVGGERPLDLAGLPTFPEKLRQVRSFVGGAAAEPDGAMYRAVGSSPLTLLLSGDFGLATSAMAISILLPSLTRARELARRAVCASNLRGIGIACQIYANDNAERFPPDLAVLLERNLLTAEQFICPSSGGYVAGAQALEAGGLARLGWTYIAGQTAGGDAGNVLAFESLANHEGEGGNVLFVDTHVEFLKPPMYGERIRETYKRLGREAEIPDELRE
jgi:prepilin-type processing-associated H-X9-DG protein